MKWIAVMVVEQRHTVENKWSENFVNAFETSWNWLRRTDFESTIRTQIKYVYAA